MQTVRTGIVLPCLVALLMTGTQVPVAGALGFPAENQAEPWWVFFDERTGEDSLAVSGPAARFALVSERALQRRRLRSSLPATGAWDLPPAAAGLRAVEGTGAVIRHTSRWLNGVSVWATPEQRAELAGLPGVRELRPVGRARHTHPPRDTAEERLPEPPDRPARDLPYGPSGPQLEEIDVPRLH